MSAQLFSTLGLAGATTGRIDVLPSTQPTASPVLFFIPWPEPTQTRIGVTRSVARLHVITNKDPNVYAVVVVWLRAFDSAIMGVAILDSETVGVARLGSGILGLIDRELNFAPDFFVVERALGGTVVALSVFSNNPDASDKNKEQFRADIDLAYEWVRLDAAGHPIGGDPPPPPGTSTPKVIALEAVPTGSKNPDVIMAVLKDDGSLWEAVVVESSGGPVPNPQWTRITTP